MFHQAQRNSIAFASIVERFCDGLDCKLYERLNLIEPNDFHDLVNKDISQEDAMKKAQRDKKM
jgi:hypothetical protein